MKMATKMLAAALFIALMSLSANAADTAAVDEKPSRLESTLLTLEATVESIDREAREVTLKDEQGESSTFVLDEDAGKLDELDPGDQVTIKYLEEISIQVFGPDELEPGSTTGTVIAESQPGEKPAGLAAGQMTIVVTIESIDLENELVTLKNSDGQLETVKPQHPENLKKVKVGDQVKITYTKALGFSVTEKPAEKK